jgi:four helix bundle protein
MDTFRFLKFKVYIDAKDYYHQLVQMVSPRIKDYSLRDQLQRAALSVVLNIAEGSAKKSDVEFARFLEIAIGSLNETVACLDLLFQEAVITKAEFEEFVRWSEELAKQLGGFMKKLRSH